MYHSLLIHSSVEGLLGCFQLGAVMNKAAANSCISCCVNITFFTSLGKIPRYRIAGLYGERMFDFIRI